MRFWMTVLALFVLIALERPGAAEDKARVEEARELAKRGIAAYDIGKYRKAIKMFERAHELAPDARLLFNIGKAYSMLGDSACDDALEYFRQYRKELRASGTPEPETLKDHIARMKKCTERQSRAAALQPSSAEEPVVESEDAPVDTPPAPPRPVRRSSRRTAGWVVAGAGALFIGTAAVTGGLALQKEAELQDVCNDLGMCPENLDDDVRSYKRLRTTAFVSGAVGLAAIAGGVWLVVTAPSEGARGAARAAARRRVTPWVGADGVGIAGEF